MWYRSARAVIRRLDGSGTRSAFSEAGDMGMARKISRCRPPGSGPGECPTLEPILHVGEVGLRQLRGDRVGEIALAEVADHADDQLARALRSRHDLQRAG
jgi:hypothetical protein